MKKRKPRKSPSTETDRSGDSTDSEKRKKRHRRKEDRRKQVLEPITLQCRSLFILRIFRDLIQFLAELKKFYISLDVP